MILRVMLVALNFACFQENLILSFSQEYRREKVQVHALGLLQDLSADLDSETFVTEHPPPLPDSPDTLTPIEAETYVYADENNLDASLWSFQDFVKHNAWKWYGGTR